MGGLAIAMPVRIPVLTSLHFLSVYFFSVYTRPTPVRLRRILVIFQFLEAETPPFHEPERKRQHDDVIQIKCHQTAPSLAPDGVPLALHLLNIPGWVVTVITQAVLLFGCRNLHFLRRPSSAGPQWGPAHS